VVGVVLDDLEVTVVDEEEMVMGLRPPSRPLPPPPRGRVVGYSF